LHRLTGSYAHILLSVDWILLDPSRLPISAAVTLALIALGTGLGLSAISLWTDTGVSATTFKVTAGVYLVLVAVMSSAIGGYLSARLRTKWVGIHSNEVLLCPERRDFR
jgi:hypothetical protein